METVREPETTERITRDFTDEDFASEVNRINALLDIWRPLLGLSYWTLACKYDDTNEMTADGPPTHDGTVCAADIDCSWEYMRMMIRFNVLATRHMDDDTLSETICHELCHAMVCELRPNNPTYAYRQHEERVVTQLAAAFRRISIAARDWESDDAPPLLPETLDP